MRLTTFEATDDAVRAGYACPCGCRPETTYVRGGAVATDGCCCGNRFAVGPHAETRLEPRVGFRPEHTDIDTPWGEPITAAWLIGPSVHVDAGSQAAGHDHDHGHEHGQAGGEGHAGHDPGGREASSEAARDPVCGMRVDPEVARAADLHVVHEGVDHFFCAKGCKLDFIDDPGRYLDPSYVPSM